MLVVMHPRVKTSNSVAGIEVNIVAVTTGFYLRPRELTKLHRFTATGSTPLLLELRAEVNTKLDYV